jgi:hypothetical protein
MQRDPSSVSSFFQFTKYFIRARNNSTLSTYNGAACVSKLNAVVSVNNGGHQDFLGGPIRCSGLG